MSQSTNTVKRRRGKLLAGALGLSLMGLAGAGSILLPETMPAQAQTATPAQVQPAQAPAQPGAQVPANQQPITVERPQNAPASFAPIVNKVKLAVVSVRVEQGGAQTSSNSRGGGGQFGFGMPDLPEDHPLYRWFRRFGEEGNQNRGENAPTPRRGTPGPQGREGGPQQRGQSQGSGFIISADGFVVTNNHVVERGQRVQVVTEDGQSHDARVVGVDDRTDLAVLKIEANREFPFVKFASTDPQVGDWVVAIGNPFGLGGTVTAGIISARGREIGAGPYDDFLQIDAPINRGNSGGPAFNLNGEVVGINTAIYSPSGGSVGIGFAIPAEVAQGVVNELRNGGEVTRGWLGVQIQPVTQDVADSLKLSEARGALVNEPQPDAPAAKAGIRTGDVILSVNGQPVQNPRDLARKIAALDPGAKAELGVYRDGRQQTLSVELGRLPAEQRQASRGDEGGQGARRPSNTRTLDTLGLELAPASAVAGSGSQGVVVTDVKPDSPASTKGLRDGDVILDVAGQSVSSPDDVARVIGDAERDGRRAVLFRVKTGEQTRFVALTMGNERRG